MRTADHESNLSSLAACSLPKTRIRGVPTGNAHGIGGCWPLTSTLHWGCGQFYDGTASARVVGKYYPYGQEKPSATANGTEKFGGYFRDSETGLDYAHNRYHNPGTGRFLTADPYQASGGPSNPASWNRYSYTHGDPINLKDPTGLSECDPMSENCDDFFEGSDPDPNGTGPVYEGACAGEALGFAPAPGVTCGYVEDGVIGPESTEEDPTKCPPQYQAWINAHGADALAAGLPEANALALTSIESNWGNGRFAKQGNDFFNLETCWTPGTPQPAAKYAYQLGWLQAGSPSDSCGKGLHYALVATYKSSLDSFKSAAATFGNLKENDPMKFAKNAVADGINAGKSSAFLTREQTFADCLKPQ